MPPFLVSPLSRVAVIAAAVATLSLVCWLKGAAHAERRFDALRAKEQAEALEHVQRLARAANEIDVVWVNTTTTVRERARVITREVPVYVSPEADARCTVPRGFVRLWNADLQADTPAAAPGGGHDEPAGLALSDVARDGVLAAKERFALNRAALEACQAWVRKVSAAP